jgi:hypothetical protein
MKDKTTALMPIAHVLTPSSPVVPDPGSKTMKGAATSTLFRAGRSIPWDIAIR